MTLSANLCNRAERRLVPRKSSGLGLRVGFYAAEEKGAILFKSDAVFRLVVLPEMRRIKQSGSISGLVAVHSDWALVEQKEE